MCAILAFLPKFGCHGNPLCSIETSDSIHKFYNPENPIICVTSSSAIAERPLCSVG